MNKIRYIFNVVKLNSRARFSILVVLFMSQIINAFATNISQVSPNFKISLSVKNANIEEVLSILEKKSLYTFLYKSEEVRNKQNISLDVKNHDFTQVLNELLTPVDLSYTVDDQVVIIKPAIANKNKQGSIQQVQERIITGIVTDEDGHTLPGTTVYLKNMQSRKVIADGNGVYRITVPVGANQRLVFSFVGMETKEVTIRDKDQLNVQLLLAENTLGEAVIVGAYGTQQKRSDLVGSAYQVNNSSFKNLPAQRIDNLLEGLVPGLKIEPNTDAASSTRTRYNVRIRGEASLSASNEPLWIIDGVRAYTGDRTNMIPGMSSSVSPLSFLSPEDIESITVLKDATMTSIYGADGANGVILVTTKKGAKGDPKLSASINYGISKINKSTLFKVLDANQYLALAKESYLNVPGNNDLTYFPYQDLPDNPYTSTNTDWTDVYYGTGNYVQSNVSVEGGSEKSNYYVSGIYYDYQPTIKGNKQQRMSLRGNVDLQLNNRLRLSMNMSSSYNINDIFNPGNDYYRIIPVISPYNPDGTYRLRYSQIEKLQNMTTGEFFPGVSSFKFFNSVAEREQNDNTQRTLASMNNIILDYGINDNLTLTSQFGADYQSAHEELYSARANWSGMDLFTEEPIGYSTRGHANFLLWTWVERLNFQKSYGKHNVSAFAAFEASSRNNRSLSTRGIGFVNDHIKEISYASRVESGSSSSTTVRMASFFGQASYGYDHRYFFTLNARKDGNSDFGADVRWGNFWSVGASWNVHNEEFFQSDLLKVFKLKASIGTNGNSRLGSQQAKGVYSYGLSDNYMGVHGGTMASVWNRRLSWERSYMTNLGLRVNFANVIDVDLEVYNKKTVDLLSELDVSRSTGDTRVVRNLGAIQNRGAELSIESKNITRSNFQWNTNANISHNKNKLLELYNGNSKVMGDKIWMEGKDIDTYYLVRWAGVDPRDGAPLWYDNTGNLTRVFNIERDRVPWKSSSPLFTGGISNNLTYKKWSLQALATFVIGGNSFSSFGRNVSSDGRNLLADNQSVNQLDRWRQPGDLALSPKPVWLLGNNNSTRNSTRYVYNTTHLRLKNISVSYEFDKNVLKRTGLSGGSVVFLVDNIGIWTPYDQVNRNSYRQSMQGYPLETTFSLGLNINL